MANKGRPGAVRKTKKGPTTGTGGHGRKSLEGKGPTPKAEDRPYHKAVPFESAVALIKLEAGKALDEFLGTIRPELYGHFIEHLGGVIYDGIWVGRESKIPNVDGIRRQFVDDMKRLMKASLVWGGEVMDRVAARIARGVDATYLSDVAPEYRRLVDSDYLAEKGVIMGSIDEFVALARNLSP